MSADRHRHGRDLPRGHDRNGRTADSHHDRARGLQRLLYGVFSHHHDPAAAADPALPSSDEGVRAVKVSLVGLAATAALQLVVVVISGSVALFADAVHNLSDALTAVPLWLAFHLARRRPNERYTYGYGRAEDLAGVVIVAMIAVSAVVAGYESVQRLLAASQVRNVGWVVGAGAIGAVGNELVAIYCIRVGRKIGSAALVADGLHARTDGLTSLAVVGGALGVAAGFPLADPIVGLVITVATVVILKDAARGVWRRLMDAVDPAVVDRIRQALGDVDGVEAVDAVRVRWVGHRLRAEVEVACASDRTLVDAHALADEAYHRLLHEVPHLAEATVHVNPHSPDGLDHHALLAHHLHRGTGMGR